MLFRSGTTYRDVCNSGLQYQAPLPTDIEFRAGLITLLGEKSPPAPGTLLAAQLYLAPHEFPCVVNIRAIPDWMRADHVAYMLTSPPLFRRPGESEIYRLCMARWVAHLQETIAEDPRGEVAAALAQKLDRKSTRLNSSHSQQSRMPSSA